MLQSFDASKSLSALDPNSTLIVVIEGGQAKWLVAAMVPGVARQPLKKIDADPEALFRLLCRWRAEDRRHLFRVAEAHETELASAPTSI